MVTSSAVVGSSAMIRRGLQISVDAKIAEEVAKSKECVFITDTVTGINYKLYIENGKLTMEVAE